MDSRDDAGDFAFEGGEIPPGSLGVSDIAALRAAALKRCSAPSFEDSDTTSPLTTYILGVGCKLWLQLDLILPLTVPSAPQWSAAFVGELLGEMARIMPRLEGFPAFENTGQALAALSSLCNAAADGTSDGDIAIKAFHTGLEIGGIGKIGENDEEYQAGWLAVGKSRDAERLRLEAMRNNKAVKQQRLLAFAITAREHDPHISNAAIERAYRTTHKKDEVTSSNSISKILARFETQKQLVKRIPFNVAKVPKKGT